MNLEDLGLTKDDIAERVVEKAVHELIEGQEFGGMDFGSMIQERIQEKIDATVMALADKHILASIPEKVEAVCLQATNKWGEAKGDPLSFVEYLLDRAEKYLTEKVDFQGNNKSESRDGYRWKESQTRVVHLVHEHLQFSIETAMKGALKSANETIAKGIEESVEVALAEIVKGIKTTVVMKQ